MKRCGEVGWVTSSIFFDVLEQVYKVQRQIHHVTKKISVTVEAQLPHVSLPYTPSMSRCIACETVWGANVMSCARPSLFLHEISFVRSQ